MYLKPSPGSMGYNSGWIWMEDCWPGLTPSHEIATSTFHPTMQLWSRDLMWVIPPEMSQIHAEQSLHPIGQPGFDSHLGQILTSRLFNFKIQDPTSHILLIIITILVHIHSCSFHSKSCTLRKSFYNSTALTCLTSTTLFSSSRMRAEFLWETE